MENAIHCLVTAGKGCFHECPVTNRFHRCIINRGKCQIKLSNVLQIGNRNTVHPTSLIALTTLRDRGKKHTLKIEREKEMESSSVFIKRFQFPSLLLKDWISLNWKSNKKTKKKTNNHKYILELFLLDNIWNHPPIRDHHSHKYHNQPYLLYGPHKDNTTRNGAVTFVTSSCAWRYPLKDQCNLSFTTSFNGDQFDVQELSKHAHTNRRIWSKQSPCSIVSSEKKSEFVHVVPLVVSIWLLLVSSVQGPRLHPRNGETSSEKQEPWVGLRLTHDSRLWGLVWVFESQPVF